MTAELFVNEYPVTLAAPCGAGDSAVMLSDASPLARLASGFVSRLKVDAEIMLATNVSGAFVTVTRGIEGTTASAHASGAIVINGLTAGALVNAAGPEIIIDCSGGGNVAASVPPGVSSVVLVNDPGSAFELQIAQTDSLAFSTVVSNQTGEFVLLTGDRSGSRPMALPSGTPFAFPPAKEVSSPDGTTVVGSLTIDLPVATIAAGGTPVVLITIPLPGLTGGWTQPGLTRVRVETQLQSQTTADAGGFDLEMAWSTLSLGVSTSMGAGTSTSDGTNAGAPPTGWAATLTLDGANENVLLTITGDIALVLDCSISLTVIYG